MYDMLCLVFAKQRGVRYGLFSLVCTNDVVLEVLWLVQMMLYKYKVCFLLETLPNNNNHLYFFSLVGNGNFIHAIHISLYANSNTLSKACRLRALGLFALYLGVG